MMSTVELFLQFVFIRDSFERSLCMFRLHLNNKKERAPKIAVRWSQSCIVFDLHYLWIR